MRRSDLLKPTFRLKLLVALIGTIAPLLLITLFVVRREAGRQVDAIVQSTANRADEAFTQIESIRQQQLKAMATRFTNSNRWGAALQQAAEGDIGFFTETTGYELQYAGVPNALAAVTDLSAQPLAAVLNRVALPDPAAAVSTSTIERVFTGDTSIFGYHQIGNQIFSVHPTVVNLVTQPVGLLQLGLAIDNETALSLGRALGADVCFVAKGKCLATSGALIKAKQIAKVTRPLPGASSTDLQIALRIPLDEAVRPFTKIQRSIQYVGLAALALATIIALILSRGLAQPVRALVAATTRVARGEYDTRVYVKSQDEIGQLATAFNDMTHGLMLKEKYRGVLDKVVSRDVADEMLKGDIRLGGELREVTTLFADVRGFTPMSESMPPQDVVALLNDIMEHAEGAIVAEGGVVDKYVGDEIMALFGAPIARGDDAMRAVRAALRMQKEVTKINEGRLSRNELGIAVGIGINTGTVVAGNMGSARRLNYTVLGAPVNLAARLCSIARSGQIIISRGTLEHVRDRVNVRELPPQDIKGITRTIQLYEVIGVDTPPPIPASAARNALAIVAAVLISSAPAAHAQRVINAGPLQVTPSARIDVAGFVPQSAPAWLIPSTNAFIAPRVSAFADMFAGSKVYGLMELRLDRGEAPSDGNLQIRIEQAFLRLTPFRRDLSLQIGRFVSPFGAYPQRHHCSSDPFIRPPLSYDYRTILSTRHVPLRNDGLLGWKLDPTFFRPKGAPPIWNTPYQLGAALIGSHRILSYRLALMNSAPSSEPNVWNDTDRIIGEMSMIANIGVQVTPEWRVGASFNKGSYLDPDSVRGLPEGKGLSEFAQTLYGVDLTFTRGLVQLRGELIHDTWQVPNVRDDAVDISYFAEAAVKLGPGLFVAARLNEIRFNEIRRDNGMREAWDYNVRRIQLGAGYRFTEHFDMRGEVMLNSSEDPADRSDNLLSLQAAWIVN